MVERDLRDVARGDDDRGDRRVVAPAGHRRAAHDGEELTGDARSRRGRERGVDARADDDRGRLSRDALDAAGVLATDVEVEGRDPERAGPRRDLVAERDAGPRIDAVFLRMHPERGELWSERFGERRAQGDEQLGDRPVVAGGEDLANHRLGQDDLRQAGLLAAEQNDHLLARTVRATERHGAREGRLLEAAVAEGVRDAREPSLVVEMAGGLVEREEDGVASALEELLARPDARVEPHDDVEGLTVPG